MSEVNDGVGISHALSPEQRAVWASLARDVDPDEACHVMGMDIEGALDAGRLKGAVDAVYRSHGVLHSAIVMLSGGAAPRQRYLGAHPALSWEEIDLREPAVETADAGPWLEGFAARPLALARGEVFRAALLRTGAARHALVLQVSVLAADQGSLTTLLHQVALAYQGLGTAQAEAPFQYERFVAWRESLAQDEATVAQAGAYWQACLAPRDDLAGPRLRYRHSAPLPGVRERLVASLRLDDALVARLDAAGSSVELRLQATWWLLLSRLTGHERFVAGWQHDCRADYEVMQGGIGVFGKILPVLVDIDAAESFAAWLMRIERMAQAHLDAQEFWPAGDPPVSAHLQAGFSFEPAFQAAGLPQGWRKASLRSQVPPCFELALHASRAGGSISIEIDAHASRYPQAALDRLLLQFPTLLQACLTAPDAPVADLAVVGPQEQHLLLAFDPAPLDVGRHNLADRVAHWATHTPDALALEAAESSLSYRALDERANQLARWLLEQGVGGGDVVALELPRSVDLVVAMLAAWRAGAAYLPLDPAGPALRRQALLQDAKAVLVLRERPGQDMAAAWKEACLAEIDLRGLGVQPTGRPVAPHDLAYVLYTSGSTGQPKGVAIEHRHLQNYAAAATAAMSLEVCRRWALTSSVVADLGNTAVFGALFNGACLVIASEDQAKDPQAFARFLVERRIDALKIVPSHLEALIEQAPPSMPGTLVLGGEAASAALIERVLRLAPACRIHNHYGPTETTIGVMVHAVDKALPARDVQPLTRVLAHNRVRVLDGRGRLVPAGAVGEIHVGGAQVCRGYVNGVGTSAFVPDPFMAGERLYRTGDLAWVLPQGGLQLVGRADHQVKIRGFRVDTSEVEAALLSQPGVRQAVVVASQRGESVELLAFVVADALDPAGVAALREGLKAVLPSHMLPSRCTAVAAFSRLPNGKVDRAALAQVDAVAPPAASPPRDALEALLAKGMGALLGRPAVGVDEDFFDLGAHSLLVIKLVARLRKLLAMEVAPSLVFDHPTVAELATALRAASPEPDRLDALAEAGLGTVPTGASAPA